MWATAFTEDTLITVRSLPKSYFMLKLSKIRIWSYLVSLNREICTIKIARRILILVLCVNFVLFVVRGLHVGHSLHGGHVDHVKVLAEVVLHAEVVKNPDLVLFGKFKQRNSYDKNRSANSYNNSYE